MDKETKFKTLIAAFDKYNEAVDMGMPEYFVNKLWDKADSLHNEIKSLGLEKEFDDYSFGYYG